jgi:hypothetical protein
MLKNKKKSSILGLQSALDSQPKKIGICFVTINWLSHHSHILILTHCGKPQEPEIPILLSLRPKLARLCIDMTLKIYQLNIPQKT